MKSAKIKIPPPTPITALDEIDSALFKLDKALCRASLLGNVPLHQEIHEAMLALKRVKKKLG